MYQKIKNLKAMKIEKISKVEQMFKSVKSMKLQKTEDKKILQLSEAETAEFPLKLGLRITVVVFSLTSLLVLICSICLCCEKRMKSNKKAATVGTLDKTRKSPEKKKRDSFTKSSSRKKSARASRNVAHQ
jgi:hypothetical protein